ncbi:MAG: LysR family transcriptional regulator, low CO2-responsive transcriptional regulator [Acidobacteriota bacterium]|jgi:DNA-binding transcriptional LysR family regulator|nr:LysR family transcriptional regulator, low CO2-responsive transcriptional regulator [Acidobacteriota bacterium]MDT7809945.1 LysR family transcriptional regulator, low CO2-responsive transcriptional regulator [Acidobacteriota bacterium]
MELSQLRTFREVAEALSFTRAAQKLNMTQSAVSHQIKALERELGEPLFIRAKRGVRLSDAGLLALDYAVRIIEEADALRERIRGDEHEPRGRVRAAAATQAFVHLFARLFESFMREHERIELSFRTTVSTEQTVADILNGAADVGFASLPVYSPALQVTELFEDELGLVVGARHRAAGEREVSVSDMRRERFILFEQGASIRRATDSFFKRVDLNPDLALESNDTYFIKLMVEHGVGVSLMPSWAVREEVEAGRLAWLRVGGHRLTRSVAVIALGRFQPSPTRAFIEYVLEHRERLQEAARAK